MDIFAQENILDHAQHPRNQGRLEQPSVSHEEHNPLCGDKVRFDLLVTDGTIADVRFSGRGCAISQAAASMLTEQIHGASLGNALAISNDDVLELLAIPIGYARRKCALLGITSLRNALSEYAAQSDPSDGMDRNVE
jgi:nitrogen fixation NifU-like protein